MKQNAGVTTYPARKLDLGTSSRLMGVALTAVEASRVMRAMRENANIVCALCSLGVDIQQGCTGI